MSQTPSARRREGRNAFSPNDAPEDFCPYQSGWNWESKREDWFEGWYEAKKDFDKKQIENEEPMQCCPKCGYKYHIYEE